MNDEESRKYLSDVGRLQAELVRQGYSQSDARNMAITRLGSKEKNAEASKIGPRTKAMKANRTADGQLFEKEAIEQAERIIGRPAWQTFYASVCKSLSWIPSDKELMAICKALNISTGKSGASNFGNSRSALRKEGFIFNERPDGHGYDVRIDKKYTKKQELLAERERIDAELAALDK